MNVPFMTESVALWLGRSRNRMIVLAACSLVWSCNAPTDVTPREKSRISATSNSSQNAEVEDEVEPAKSTPKEGTVQSGEEEQSEPANHNIPAGDNVTNAPETKTDQPPINTPVPKDPSPQTPPPQLPPPPPVTAPTPKFSGTTIAIPPRIQWPNANGYCGEASIQSIGLYNGAWISQQLVRDLAGGELLLGVNADSALNQLHFTYQTWRSNAQSQLQPFLLWTKSNIVKGIPVIFTVYLSGSSDPDYDHIMPAVGVETANPQGTTFSAEDRLVFNNLFSTTAIKTSFGTIGATRAACRLTLNQGGCVPSGTDYGIAVTGFLDPDKATLPIKLTVDSPMEPNISTGSAPGQLKGTVTAYELKPGATYALLRFDGYRTVPVAGTAADWLKAAFASRMDFKATSDTWTYTDPKTIPTNGSVYYKVVQVSP